MLTVSSVQSKARAYWYERIVSDSLRIILHLPTIFFFNRVLFVLVCRNVILGLFLVCHSVKSVCCAYYILQNLENRNIIKCVFMPYLD